MLQLWYKNAILYCLDVEVFQDSNGDGVGDFRGLTKRLDYLAGLGVTCVWLMPFYPTPNRDNGYDVTDYFGVDPRLGHLGDFVDFMEAARNHGIRVIIDLVINHTSVDHPWFQDARSSPDARYRDYYVWKDHKPEDADEGMVFPGYQETTWTYDRKAKAYYFHRFYDHQAELNIANPSVRDEIRRVMAFWLKLGVSGFRVDAVPFLIELKDLKGAEVDAPYDYLTEFRNYLSWQQGDAVLLAEANIAMDEIPKYFADGNKLHMMFNFMLNQHVMLALQRGDALPIREGLYQPPPIPFNCQFVNFLRNHDEFALGRLSENQQEDLYKAFAPKENMRIYNRGIRRRLPPMLNGHIKKLKLSHSLLLSLPGTPVINYGEEIGMGEDLSLDERNSIRTPMQWSGDPNGGFSTAPRNQCVRPPVNSGNFAFKKVNVLDQERDADSLLEVTTHMIRVRRENSEFGWGKWQIVDTRDQKVLAHRCDYEGRTVLAIHNMGDKESTFIPDVADLKGRRIKELLSDAPYETPLKVGQEVTVGPLGYRWFRYDPEP